MIKNFFMKYGVVKYEFSGTQESCFVIDADVKNFKIITCSYLHDDDSDGQDGEYFNGGGFHHSCIFKEYIGIKSV